MVIEAGGVPRVVRAMRTFKNHAGVVAQATRALANIASGDQACAKAVHVGGAAKEEAVGELGGAASVAAALMAHPRQLEVWWAMWKTELCGRPARTYTCQLAEAGRGWRLP